MVGKHEINKKQCIVIAVAILVGILTSLAFTVFVNIIFPQPTFYFGRHRFIAVALIVSSLICLVYYRKYFMDNLHKAFLLITLAFGISLTLVFPQAVYLSADDHIHFRNSYVFMDDATELKGGFLAIESNNFANVEDKGFDELSKMYLVMNEVDDTITVEYHTNETPQLYRQVTYLPFYLGLKVSELLHLNFTTGVIIAKICDLVCYVFLVYIAIRESGKMSRVFFVIGLLVSNIFLATQFSYDPIIIASILLAISLFLHIYQSETVSTKRLLGFILTVTLGSLVKGIYCPLMLLLLIIPNSKFDSKKRAITFKVCAMLVMLTLASTFVLPVLGGSMAGDIRGGNTSVSGQLHFLLSNPFLALAIVARFFIMTVPSCITSTVMFLNLGAGATAGVIYHICEPVTSIVWTISFVTLLWAVFSTNGQGEITKQLKIVSGVLFVLLAGMIFASMYLSFTSVGSADVDGVQPRYFMPILPLLLIPLIPIRSKCRETPSNQVILFAPCLMLILIFGAYVLHMSML